MLGDATRGRTAPNPNVGCVIVSQRRRDRRPRRDPARRSSACRGRRSRRGRAKSARDDPLHHARALRPRQRARTDLRRADRRKRAPRRSSSRWTIPTSGPPARASSGSGRRWDRGGCWLWRGGGAQIPCPAISPGCGSGRPRITLKLALSIDGKIAMPSGESKWISGEDARAHVHLERARSDMILVGRGTYLADAPRLDVRLPGLEDRSPRRALLTRGDAVDGWEIAAIPAGRVSGFMTSTICWSKAVRRPPPPSSRPTSSTGS